MANLKTVLFMFKRDYALSTRPFLFVHIRNDVCVIYVHTQNLYTEVLRVCLIILTHGTCVSLQLDMNVTQPFNTWMSAEHSLSHVYVTSTVKLLGSKVHFKHLTGFVNSK